LEDSAWADQHYSKTYSGTECSREWGVRVCKECENGSGTIWHQGKRKSWEDGKRRWDPNNNKRSWICSGTRSCVKRIGTVGLREAMGKAMEGSRGEMIILGREEVYDNLMMAPWS
jgi:hypothetical protein